MQTKTAIFYNRQRREHNENDMRRIAEKLLLNQLKLAGIKATKQYLTKIKAQRLNEQNGNESDNSDDSDDTSNNSNNNINNIENSNSSQKKNKKKKKSKSKLKSKSKSNSNGKKKGEKKQKNKKGGKKGKKKRNGKQSNKAKKQSNSKNSKNSQKATDATPEMGRSNSNSMNTSATMIDNEAEAKTKTVADEIDDMFEFGGGFFFEEDAIENDAVSNSNNKNKNSSNDTNQNGKENDETNDSMDRYMGGGFFIENETDFIDFDSNLNNENDKNNNTNMNEIANDSNNSNSNEKPREKKRHRKKAKPGKREIDDSDSSEDNIDNNNDSDINIITQNNDKNNNSNNNNSNNNESDSDDEDMSRPLMSKTAEMDEIANNDQQNRDEIVSSLLKKANAAKEAKKQRKELKMFDNDNSESSDDLDDIDFHMIPENVSLLTAEDIAKLPATMQYDIMQKRRDELRHETRSEFVSAASNPEQYSQVQMKNFLKTSHLNMKIEKIRTEMTAKYHQKLLLKQNILENNGMNANSGGFLSEGVEMEGRGIMMKREKDKSEEIAKKASYATHRIASEMNRHYYYVKDDNNDFMPSYKVKWFDKFELEKRKDYQINQRQKRRKLGKYSYKSNYQPKTLNISKNTYKRLNDIYAGAISADNQYSQKLDHWNCVKCKHLNLKQRVEFIHIYNLCKWQTFIFLLFLFITKR